MSVTAEIWSSWAAGRLELQGCAACGQTQHPPGPVCHHCYATRLELVPISGVGSILSWSMVHRAPAPEFADQVPYALVLVDTTEGALVQARLASEAVAPSLAIGRPVTLVLQEGSGGRQMPVVHLVRDADDRRTTDE